MALESVPPGGRVGILGGTFDPIHVGHLALGECARDQLGLDGVLFMVAADPYQKTAHRPVRAASERLLEVAAAVADVDYFWASDLEMKRPGPTFAVDTVGELKVLRPDLDLVWILGSDAARGLPEWSRAGTLAEAIEFGVVIRDGDTRAGLEAELGSGWRLQWIDMPAVDVSSTAIRNLLNAGHSARFLVPEGAYPLVKRHFSD